MRRVTFCALALAVALLAFPASPAAAKRLIFNDLNSADIRSIDLDGSNLHTIFSTGDVSTSLAYDSQASKIYWGVDASANYIGRANLDGSDGVTFPLSDGPDALAIDSAAGKLYFAAEDSNTIQRLNLDGTGQETIITDPQNYSYGLALDVAAGKLYWTLTGVARYVDRANLDGSRQEDLIIEPGPGLTFGQPFGIALDVGGGKLYFSDEDDSLFYRANLDGAGLEAFKPQDAMHPHGIVLDLAAQRIYWAQRGGIGGSDFDGSNAVLYNVPGYPHNLILVPEPTAWLLAGGLWAIIVAIHTRKLTSHALAVC